MACCSTVETPPVSALRCHALQVYLGRWHETAVACKVLLQGGRDIRSAAAAQRALSIPTAVLAKLEEEASLLASLRHPCIVSFYGICRKPPCIVTEYCSRGSLVDLLAAARRDASVAAMLTWHRRLSMVSG